MMLSEYTLLALIEQFHNLHIDMKMYDNWNCNIQCFYVYTLYTLCPYCFICIVNLYRFFVYNFMFSDESTVIFSGWNASILIDFCLFLSVNIWFCSQYTWTNLMSRVLTSQCFRDVPNEEGKIKVHLLSVKTLMCIALINY